MSSPSTHDGFPSTALAKSPTTGGPLVPTSSDPRSYVTVEGHVGLPPDEAVEALRRRIERVIGARGHRQGARAASIVDERRRVTTHIDADPSGDGSEVHVRLDVSAARAFRLLLGGAAVVSTLLLAGIAYVTTPWVLVVAAVDAAIMGALLAQVKNAERAAIRDVYHEATRALAALDTPAALPEGVDAAPTD